MLLPSKPPTLDLILLALATWRLTSLLVWEDGGVLAERECLAGMAEPPRDNVSGRSCLQEECGAGVSHVVQTDAPHA